MTKNWLYQLILGLVLICHSSYRGIVELFRNLFDTSISIGTVHNRLEAASATAAEINQAQDQAQGATTYRIKIEQQSQLIQE